MTIEKLTPDQLRVATEATLFEFKNSAALTPAKPCTAQNRAVAALKTALTVPGPEYHQRGARARAELDACVRHPQSHAAVDARGS